MTSKDELCRVAAAQAPARPASGATSSRGRVAAALPADRTHRHRSFGRAATGHVVARRGGTHPGTRPAVADFGLTEGTIVGTCILRGDGFLSLLADNAKAKRTSLTDLKTTEGRMGFRRWEV